MATIAPQAPPSFAAAQRQRALESHQAMSKALKEHRFDDALEHARTALALEPDNVMIKEFHRLLEEKQELDETDDESDTEGGAAGKPGGQTEATSSEEDEDEDDEDEGEESEEESSEEESDESEVDEAVAKALSGLRLGEPEEDPDQPRPLQISAAARGAMRAKLAARIKELKQGEMAAKLMAADPLLGV